MLRPRIIPCLLLKNNGLVKTVQFKNATYIGDPINAVKIFNDKEVDELIFLDITATAEHREPNLELIRTLSSEAFMPFSYGGGISTLDQIRSVIRNGAEKVIINTAAVRDPELISHAVRETGSQSIVVSMDIKKSAWGRYHVYTENGSYNTKRDPVEHARSMQTAGAGELFVNSIDRDGTQKGYDILFLKQLAEAVSIPVIACGGAGTLEDVQMLFTKTEITAAAAGSLFVFHGPHRAVLINYPSPKEIDSLYDEK